MDLPSLRQLRTFLAVVERGSVTEAARSLHLTQPAASQQLREMERILATRLLDRVDGRAVPTVAGRAILDAARRSCAAAAEVVDVAASCRSGETGRVRLGTGATACIHFLPPALAAARRRMPGLEIVVVTGNTPDILRRVEEGSLDAGLVTLPRRVGRSLTVLRLCRDELVALLPAGTPGRAPARAAQLAALPLILYEPGGDTRVIVDAWFRRAGLAPHPVMELGSVEAIKVLVTSGLGSAILPAMALPAPIVGTERRQLSPSLARELGFVVRTEKIRDAGLRVMQEVLEALA